MKISWVVKSDEDCFPYVASPIGEVFAPDLKNAYRFKTREQARRVTRRLTRTTLCDTRYKVYKVTTRDPREIERRAIQEFVEEFAMDCVPSEAYVNLLRLSALIRELKTR